MKVFGVQDVLNAFGELPRVVRGRHMRMALNAGAGIIRNMAVTFAPRETGLLRKSLKVKVKVPEQSFNAAHHSRPAYALVGASRKVVGLVRLKSGVMKTVTLARLKKTGFRGNLIQKRRPSRYLHLVERGTKARGKHPGTRAQRPLERAVAFAGPVAQAKMIQKLKDGIQNWASTRRVRKGGAIALGA